jgi:aminoglycoside phosphotransferase (APT) family kinase protein
MRSDDPHLPTGPLARFLDDHAIGEGPITARRLAGGNSNLTYAVDRGPVRVVVRRPPPPPIPPGAHDMVREARLLAALGPTPARVPQVLAVGEDPEILGAPFYVMEYIDGVALTGKVPPELAAHDGRRRVGEEVVDALAEIHAVDWRAAGLAELGRPDGYLERQIRRFLRLWEHNCTRDLPAVERVGEWLGRHLPETAETTVVHGDYRLGNVMLALPESGGGAVRARAVFDWELATLGDPLADLGYLCATWVQPGDPPLGMFERTNAMRAPGFPSRDELVARYALRTGRAIGDISWYRALALWKTVVFMEGNHKRALAVGTDDPFIATLGDRVAELAGYVDATTRRNSII